MTGTFLDDTQTDRLGERWHTLANLITQLEDLIAGSVMGVASSLGIRIARAPASRPPINVAAHDHLDLIRAATTGWTRCLLDDALIETPHTTTANALARHLHIHADRIATCDWAPDCLAEVEDLTAQAERITGPEDSGSITDRHHLDEADIHHNAHRAQGNAADMIVVHRAVTGHQLTEHQIRQWHRDGKLTKHTGPGGEPQFRYHEVASAALNTRIRRLPITATSSNPRP